MNELFKNVLVGQFNAPIDVVQKLWSIVHPISFPEKTIIGRPGEMNDYSYFVFEGCAKQYLFDQYDQEYIVNLWGPSDFITCSLPSFYLNKKSLVYTATISKFKGIRMHKQDFINLGNSDTRVYELLTGILLHYYLRQEQREIRLVQLSGKERYLHFLDQYPEFIGQVSMKNVASYLQIHPGSLSRIKKNLKT